MYTYIYIYIYIYISMKIHERQRSSYCIESLSELLAHVTLVEETLPLPSCDTKTTFVSQSKALDALYHLLLDLDNCLTPEAQNWTYLN